MTIIRNTPEELVVRSSLPLSVLWPVAFVVVLLGAGLLALLQGDYVAGLGCILLAAFPAYFVRRDARLDHARLSRSGDVLEIRRFSWRGRERVRHPLSDLSHAFADQLQWGKERRSCVVLVLDRGMDAGQHPLISHHMMAARADQAADAVNKWLQASPRQPTEGS